MAENKFKCPDCGKPFDTKERMMQHKKDTHTSTETKKKPMNHGKIMTYAVVALILVAVAGVAYWVVTGMSGTSNTINNFDFSFVPFQGNSTAKINIIEFGDYQCPICQIFFTSTEPQIFKDYVDTGKAKFYFMDFTVLGPDSQTLAQGAWCANEQNLYYAYHDYIYSNQGPENSGWATPDKVKNLTASIHSLNMQQFDSCLDSQKYQQRIKQLLDVGGNSGVSGTPTFFIGNNNTGYVKIVGNEQYSVFQQTIDSQLAKVA